MGQSGDRNRSAIMRRRVKEIQASVARLKAKMDGKLAMCNQCSIDRDSNNYKVCDPFFCLGPMMESKCTFCGEEGILNGISVCKTCFSALTTLRQQKIYSMRDEIRKEHGYKSYPDEEDEIKLEDY